MKVFDTFEQVEGMIECRKKPIIVHSKKIDEEFRVKTLEGDYKQGKPGDRLMQGVFGELYICDKDIYEKTYDDLLGNVMTGDLNGLVDKSMTRQWWCGFLVGMAITAIAFGIIYLAQ